MIKSFHLKGACAKKALRLEPFGSIYANANPKINTKNSDNRGISKYQPANAFSLVEMKSASRVFWVTAAMSRRNGTVRLRSRTECLL